MLLLLSGCGLNTQVYKPIDLTSYKSGVLKIAIDYWNLQDDLARRIESLGIDVVDLSNSKEPDILIAVRYQTKCVAFLNLVECKITFFDIDFKDSKTGDLFISSHYQDMGDYHTTKTDINYIDHFLDSLFNDIKKKMKIL